VTRAPEAPASATPSLAHRASRGAVVTIGGQWSRTALQLVSTVILARLLVPADFGLVAMVTAIVGVAELVREFGLSGAIVRLREIDEAMWAALYRFSFLLGLATMALTAAVAPLIAALYDEPRLIALTFALAPIVLLNSIAMPLQARLQRELRFGLIALSDALSMAVGVVGAVVAAALGAGVWSLVLLTGLSSLYRLVAMLAAVRPSISGARPMRELLPVLTVGGSIFGVQLLNYAARNLDNVFIGRALGPAVLGVYSRAYGLLMLPISQLNGPLARVGLPVLSRLQDDEAAYRRYLRTAMLVIGYAAIPTFALAAAVSGPLVALLLGPQWDAAAPIFALLAIAGIAQALGNVSGWLYISLGRSHRQLLYFLVSKPLVILSFVLGLWANGVLGLALVYGIVSCALLVPGFLFAIHGTFVRAADVFAPIVRPVLLAPLIFAAAWFASTAVPLPAIAALALGATAAMLVLSLALVVPAYRRDARRIAVVLRHARKES
jgi:PST family polysaccharide transporter